MWKPPHNHPTFPGFPGLISVKFLQLCCFRPLSRKSAAFSAPLADLFWKSSLWICKSSLEIVEWTFDFLKEPRKIPGRKVTTWGLAAASAYGTISKFIWNWMGKLLLITLLRDNNRTPDRSGVKEQLKSKVSHKNPRQESSEHGHIFTNFWKFLLLIGFVWSMTLQEFQDLTFMMIWALEVRTLWPVFCMANYFRVTSELPDIAMQISANTLQNSQESEIFANEIPLETLKLEYLLGYEKHLFWPSVGKNLLRFLQGQIISYHDLWFRILAKKHNILKR